MTRTPMLEIGIFTSFFEILKFASNLLPFAPNVLPSKFVWDLVTSLSR